MPDTELLAGGGRPGFAGNGGVAASALLHTPTAAAVDRRGNLYIADFLNGRVRMVTPGGTITTVAGTGTFEGPGGSVATEVSMAPVAVAVGRSGTLYVVDAAHHRVLAVSGHGGTEVVAGTGRPGFSGDHGPATSAELNGPTDVEISRGGDVYIADAGNRRVRRVSTTGEITSVAGTGEPGFLGEGGPAVDADLAPWGLGMGMDGTLYVVEADHNRVRQVLPDGTITTAAGTGEPGRAGDGDWAVEAMLDSPQDAAADARGNLYIADLGNHRIRRVTPDGIITTMYPGPTGATSVLAPVGLAVDPEGRLLFTDVFDHTVRRMPAGS